MKNKTLVAIFAHPDDEAFGPAGTLAKYAKDGWDVYILCATSGEEGQNHHPKAKEITLHETRRQELRESAKILGVKKVYFLGFQDGTLCNNNYHKLAEKITKKLKTLKPQTILTFEPRGISGHLDHVAVSMVSSFVFHKLSFVKTIMYHARLYDNQRDTKQDYFVYFPPGYQKNEIDKTIDIEQFWDTKVHAMKQHVTQIKDMKRILENYKKHPKQEYFLIKEK